MPNCFLCQVSAGIKKSLKVDIPAVNKDSFYLCETCRSNIRKILDLVDLMDIEPIEEEEKEKN